MSSNSLVSKRDGDRANGRATPVQSSFLQVTVSDSLDTGKLNVSINSTVRECFKRYTNIGVVDFVPGDFADCRSFATVKYVSCKRSMDYFFVVNVYVGDCIEVQSRVRCDEFVDLTCFRRVVV